ncbi:MAG: phytanoyl-CoA dioxygenase family protein [Gammaproteobacteria bacterium]|nr:phytanoyl-CoA dioxygenase family protein [Gammaproteobacteria bacterium]
MLKTPDMARFVARGFLRFDGVVPAALNDKFLDQVGRPPAATGENLMKAYGKLLAATGVPTVPAGTPLARAYAPGSAIHEILQLPVVSGAIQSLVGENPVFDHHFLHITFPPEFYAALNRPNVSQHTHQDSTIDPRRAFDIQIMYFPHAVTREMGGTRFVPGTHLRIVSEAAVGRYQNIRGQQHVVCPAGTVLVLHHGIWHGGGVNHSDRLRYMFKIRINPSVRQERLWDTSDLGNDHHAQRPIFLVKEAPDPEHPHTILTTPEPWFEADTGRLEYLNRIRLWRHLLGDSTFDADYWLTRVENEPA